MGLSQFGNVLILLVVTSKAVCQLQRYCPMDNKHKDVHLQWTVTPATLALGCIGQYTMLHCCAAGYKTILWYIHRPSGVLEPVHFNYKKYLQDENQTLLMLQSELQADSGNYTCVVSDGHSDSIKNTVRLLLQNCANWFFPPLIYQPDKSETTVKSLIGENLTQPCEAFYANCSQNLDSCFIDWVRINANGSITVITEGNTSSRVYTQSYNDRETNIGRTDLHINNIEKLDFGRYQCQAYSARGVEKKTIDFERKYPKKPWNVIVVSCCFGFLVALVVASSLVKWQFGPDIKLYIKDKYFRRSPDEALEYDAAVLYAEDSPDDQHFAEEIICKTLSHEYKYKIFSQKDIMAGTFELSEMSCAQDRCECIIFVISPMFFKDRKCFFVFQEIVEEKYRNFIFVIYQPVSNKLEKEISEEEDTKILFRALKMGRKFNWPREGRPKKEFTTFWKKLLYELPHKIREPRTQSQIEHGHLHQSNTSHQNYGACNNAYINAAISQYGPSIQEQDTA